MDAITLQRIEQAHPKIRKQLLQQYKEANNLLGKNVRLRFAYVFRTPQEQSKLFKQRPKVTNADAWRGILTRFTFLNIIRHKLMSTYVGSKPEDLFLIKYYSDNHPNY